MYVLTINYTSTHGIVSNESTSEFESLLKHAFSIEGELTSGDSCAISKYVLIMHFANTYCIISHEYTSKSECPHNAV